MPGVKHEDTMRSIKLFNDRSNSKNKFSKNCGKTSRLIMDLNLRKFAKFVDKTFIEGGKKAKNTCFACFCCCCNKKSMDAEKDLWKI